MEHTRLVSPGSFCWNPDCLDYGKVNNGNIIKFGRTKKCLALLAERNSLAAIHRVKGIKEETVSAWLREAAKHVEQIEALLLANYRLRRAQLDALWTYVGHKGKKGGIQRKRNEVPSGEGLSST